MPAKIAVNQKEPATTAAAALITHQKEQATTAVPLINQKAPPTTTAALINQKEPATIAATHEPAFIESEQSITKSLVTIYHNFVEEVFHDCLDYSDLSIIYSKPEIYYDGILLPK
jgi:hypothetical protein